MLRCASQSIEDRNDDSLRLALIHNPLSRRNRRDGPEFIDMARAALGENFLEPRSRPGMYDEVRKLADRGIDTICISGGDGTVSDVMTAIHHAYPKNALPSLAIFPSGNTNLIAGDLGFRQRGPAALRLLLDNPEKLSHAPRRPLLVSWPDGSQPERLGMFHGSTGYARAIAIAHSPTVLRYAPHELGVIATFIGAFGALIFRGYREHWFNGDEIVLDAGGERIAHKRSFLFLATGLRHLERGIWPFWRRPGDPLDGIHFLDVADHPRRLVQATWALLRGRAPDWLRAHPDYRSGCVDKVVLRTTSDFVIDGEQISPGPGETIVIAPGPEFIFLQD